MSLDTFNAVLEGYNDRVCDWDLLSAKAGFWSGYYSNSKRPKPLDHILKHIRDGYKGTKSKKRKHADSVDVEAFLQQEAEFQARLLEMEK